MKVVPQAANCREIEVGGRVYRRDKRGLFDLPESAAKFTIKHEGGQAPALSGATSRRFGFRCLACGFGSFFATCSKCGGDCARENELQTGGFLSGENLAMVGEG